MLVAGAGGWLLKRLFERSVVARTGMTLGAVILSALVGMGASVVITDTAQGDAAALNVAGSLRMQSFRIATRISASEERAAQMRSVEEEARDFEQRLYSRELTGPIPRDPDHPLKRSYDGVVEQWEERLSQLLLKVGDRQPTETEQDLFLDKVHRFVDDIYEMVNLLEEEAEAKIQLLRLIQGVAILSTMFLVLVAMYQLHTRVVMPLRDLGRVADRARQGGLSARARYEGPDELGTLSRSFNVMSENLAKLHASLEHQVQGKTTELRRSNRALQLLYDMARDVNPETIEHTDLRTVLLRPLEEVTGLGPLTLCLSNPGSHRAYQVFSTAPCERPGFCCYPDCERCLTGFTSSLESASEEKFLRFPLVEKRQQYGVLLVERSPVHPSGSWQVQLAETVAGHIASTYSLARQTEQHRRLALMEERAVIARELHDSLAQSLSYLKIQVMRLERAIKQGASARGRVEDVVGELRDGLNTAYRQLRELLTTFRLKIEEPGLEPALRSTVEEFSRRGGLRVDLDYQPTHRPLSSNEEIHVLQVVREALANVVQHAGAEEACVRLREIEDHGVEVTVDDNGQGPQAPDLERNHHGIAIMEERANSLDGSLEVISRAEGGTRIRMVFTPHAVRGLLVS